MGVSSDTPKYRGNPKQKDSRLKPKEQKSRSVPLKELKISKWKKQNPQTQDILHKEKIYHNKLRVQLKDLRKKLEQKFM